MAIEIPSGLNVKNEAIEKAIAEGKFMHVNIKAKAPTMITVGGITNMFASIANGKKSVNGHPITTADGYMYLPVYGLAGPLNDIVTVLRNKGYSETEIQAVVDDEANIDASNYKSEGTISADAAKARQVAQAERRAANPTATRSRASGTTNWAALMMMARNKTLLQAMSKTNHMEKCSATRVNRGKKSQYEGVLSRIQARKDGAYLDLNHIDKPANANRAIKLKAIAADSKVQGAYLDDPNFPIFSNNEANVRRFANQYKKMTVAEGVTKLTDQQVNAAVDEWKENFDTWSRSQAARKKKVVITSSSIDKSKVIGTSTKAAPRIEVKKTSTMSRPAVAAAKIAPVEDDASDGIYDASPRVSRSTPRVLSKAKAAVPIKRGSRSSASSVASAPSVSASVEDDNFDLPEEDEEDEFDL